MSEMAIIPTPDKFIFETVMRIRHTEIDSGDNLTMESLVALLTESRARFLHAKGLSDVNVGSQGLIITDIATSFLNRAKVREALLFEVGVQNIHTNGGDFIFKVSRMNDMFVIANAQMSFVMYDFLSNKVIALTPQLRQTLTENILNF